eukprot:1195164-Prorocentrum_minimum.AAC.1
MGSEVSEGSPPPAHRCPTASCQGTPPDSACSPSHALAAAAVAAAGAGRGGEHWAATDAPTAAWTCESRSMPLASAPARSNK